MDYEDILFGLQPILNADSLKDVPLNDIYLNSYLTVMDQLAASLRAPDNRDIVRETSLLSNLLRVLNESLDLAIHDTENINNLAFWKISSELIRCVANCLVDNDKNRKVLLNISSNNTNLTSKKIEIIDYYITRILSLMQINNNSDDDSTILSDLQMRCIVLIKNLCIDNEEYTKRIAPHIRSPIFTLIKNSQYSYLEETDTIGLALEVLSDIIQVYSDDLSVTDMALLASFTRRVANSIESVPQDDDIEISNINENGSNNDNQNDIEQEDDTNSEIIYSITECLEACVSNEENNIDFDCKSTPEIQRQLLDSLDILSTKEFTNKLIIMRRLITIIGHISANKSNPNHDERDMTYEIIKKSINGYTIAAAFMILTNSVASKEDTDVILKSISIEEIIKTSKYMKDPVQYQGFLDLLKKLFNLTNAMFLSTDTIISLFDVLKSCSEQIQLFPNLSPLLDNLLKKLIIVLPSTTITSILIDGDEINSLLILNIVKARGSFISCLLLDKLLVSKKIVSAYIMEELWKEVFKMKDNSNGQESGVSIPFLFQVTKTLGIYLRNCSTDKSSINDVILFNQYHESFTELLEAILPLGGHTDKGSESVFNNGKYVAGMVINILNCSEILTPEESKLKELAKKFF